MYRLLAFSRSFSTLLKLLLLSFHYFDISTAIICYYLGNVDWQFHCFCRCHISALQYTGDLSKVYPISDKHRNTFPLHSNTETTARTFVSTALTMCLSTIAQYLTLPHSNTTGFSADDLDRERCSIYLSLSFRSLYDGEFVNSVDNDSC